MGKRYSEGLGIQAAIRAVLLALAVLQVVRSQDTNLDQCLANTFPVAIGGSSSERVRCTVFDKVNR